MRRVLCLLSLAAPGLLAAVPPAAAQPVEFHASVRGSFGVRASIDCPPDLDCGTARIDGFGKATRSLGVTGATPGVPAGCTTLTAIDHMVLDSDGSILDLAVTAALCYPAGSSTAPGQQGQSQGNPFRATGTFEVIGGTGVFAGAGGSGTLTGLGAGDAIVIHYAGALTLP